MELVADIFLGAGALGAGLYCLILARRLNRFNDLEKGVGGAVAVLSAQVDDLTKTLVAAQTTSANAETTLTELTTRAEATANRLELMMASLHDIQDPAPVQATKQADKQVDSSAEPAEPMFVRHGKRASNQVM